MKESNGRGPNGVRGISTDVSGPLNGIPYVIRWNQTECTRVTPTGSVVIVVVVLASECPFLVRFSGGGPVVVVVILWQGLGPVVRRPPPRSRESRGRRDPR